MPAGPWRPALRSVGALMRCGKGAAERHRAMGSPAELFATEVRPWGPLTCSPPVE
jgi:hypothetical protein